VLLDLLNAGFAVLTGAFCELHFDGVLSGCGRLGSFL